VLARVYAVMVPTHRDRSGGLVDDLRRLGELAAGEHPASTPAPATATAP
jgi:hypothetical protein